MHMNMEKKIIWDNLPDCLLDNIYKKIVYTQPKNLLDDIVSYTNTIKYIKNNLDLYSDWFILWCILLMCINDNKEIEKKFKILKNYVNKNNNLMIRYEGGMYWIKRYMAKFSVKQRDDFIKYMNDKDY